MNRKKAILLLISASILWSTGGIFIKMVNMNPIAIAGARSGIAAVIMFLYLRKPITDFNSKKIIGALFYASLTILFCSANKLTTSANAILLQFTAPIWVVLFSKWFLKEKIHKSDWLSIVFVFCGMILFFLGSINMGHIAGNIIAILSGVAMAGMVIMLKLQKNGSPVEMTLLGNIFVFIIGLPFILRSTPNKSSIMGLIILGIFQLGISYIMYASSVKYVSSLEAVLITVLEPLLNPVWVFIFSGEAPGKFAFLGGAIVLVTVILKSIYQQKIYAEDQSSIEKAAE